MLSLTFLSEAGAASGPVGTVHRVVVYRIDGSIIDTKTVDTSSGTVQQSLTGLPSGPLRLHVGLSAVAGGPETGAVDTTFQGGSAPAPMQFVMRQAVSGAILNAPTPTVNVGSTQQLYAAGKSSDGSFVYTAPTDWTWTAEFPGFASVNDSGLVTGVAEGGTSVQAKHTTSGKAASVNIGVLGNGVRRGKWTVMVFVNAANNLYEEAVKNVNQMERIANNPDVRFVIQWKQVKGIPSSNSGPIFSGTRRYLATYDSMSLTNVNNTIRSTVVQDMGGGVDMGSGVVLGSFVSWAKTSYPADHYALVVWDHGSGWYSPRSLGPKARVISTDDETDNYMTMGDVRGALAGQRLDVLAYDACLMQGAETLVEMSDKADFIIGSEENTPFPGYPYQTVFKPFVDTPDAPVADLTQSLVTEFQKNYAKGEYADWQLHQSVVETSKLGNFQLALENFSLALLNAPGGVGQLLPNVRASLGNIAPGEDYSYYDLDQLCEKVVGLSTNANIVTKANDLRASLANVVIHNGSNTPGSFMKGLSIEFARSSRFNGTYGRNYGALRMASLTNWDEVLSSPTVNP